jgi:hypothetical protein
MRSLCLFALLAVTACSWDPDKSDITVHVTGISQSTNDNVDHLTVTLTLADGPHTYTPTFGPQSSSSVDLSLSGSGQTGPFTVSVQQSNHNKDTIGVAGTASGSLPGTAEVTVALAPTGAP